MADIQDKRDEKIGRAIATIIAGYKKGMDEIINFQSEKR
jgi:hypothetical protein